MKTDNLLFTSDSLKALEFLIENKESIGPINLIYIDPPYNSGKNYKNKAGELVFTDIPGKMIDENVSLREDIQVFLGYNRPYFGDNMYWYLVYLSPRIVLLRELLSKNGLFYLHCDHHACHYIKILLDIIFGREHFLNEIIWAYRTGGVNGNSSFARKHDNILLYSKTDTYVFNNQKEKSYRGGQLSSKIKTGVHWAGKGKAEFFRDEKGLYCCVNRRDVWAIESVYSNKSNKIDYPTQKPEELLELIIKSSTNENDTVLDPCCGSGTTLVVAQKLNRRWIGIDISEYSKKIVLERFKKSFGSDVVKNIDLYNENDF